MNAPVQTLRPAQVCRALLGALDASAGRSRARKRDQTPDAIGLDLRRHLLEQVVRDDPQPQDFEAWLLEHAQASDTPGAARVMAHAVLDEWRLAHQLDTFAAWLTQGAPSDDTQAHPRSSPGAAWS